LRFQNRLDRDSVNFGQLPMARPGQHALVRPDLRSECRDRDAKFSTRTINQSPVHRRWRRCLSSVPVGAKEWQQRSCFRFSKDVRPPHGQKFIYGQPSPTVFFARALNSVSLARTPQRLASIL
jgi:hypothetical protein